MRIRTGPCGRWEFGAHKWKLGLKYYTNSSEWQCGSHRGNSREQRPHTPAVTGVWRVTGVAECSQLIMKQKQSACRLKLEAELERQCAPNAHSQRRGRVRSTADFRGRNMRDIWLAGRIHNNTIITAWDACTGAGGGVVWGVNERMWDAERVWKRRICTEQLRFKVVMSIMMILLSVLHPGWEAAHVGQHKPSVHFGTAGYYKSISISFNQSDQSKLTFTRHCDGLEPPDFVWLHKGDQHKWGCEPSCCSHLCACNDARKNYLLFLNMLYYSCHCAAGCSSSRRQNLKEGCGMKTEEQKHTASDLNNRTLWL